MECKGVSPAGESLEGYKYRYILQGEDIWVHLLVTAGFKGMGTHCAGLGALMMLYERMKQRAVLTTLRH